MKKCIKLLSCIMAFAIVMSMVVLPVSAATENLAKINGGGVQYAGENQYNKNEYQFTCTDKTGTSNTTIFVRNVPVEAGKTYYFSYEVMIKNTTKSIQTWIPSGQTITGITSTTETIPAGTYYKFEGIGTASTSGKLHFGPRIMFNDPSKTIYFKNPKAYEKSDFAVSTDAAAEMALDGVITYSFTNPVNGLTASNFTDMDVEVTQVSDCVYTVAPQNLSYSTSYELKMTNVTDVFGQTLADSSIQFTTEKPPVPVIDGNLVTNGNFESNSIADWTVATGATAVPGKDYAYSGDYGVLVTPSTGSAASEPSFAYTFHAEANKKYFISAMIKPTSDYKMMIPVVSGCGLPTVKSPLLISKKVGWFNVVNSIAPTQTGDATFYIQRHHTANTTDNLLSSYYIDDVYIYELKLAESENLNPDNGVISVNFPSDIEITSDMITLSSGNVTGISYAEGNWHIAYENLASNALGTVKFDIPIHRDSSYNNIVAPDYTTLSQSFSFTTTESAKEALYSYSSEVRKDVAQPITDLNFDYDAIGNVPANITSDPAGVATTVARTGGATGDNALQIASRSDKTVYGRFTLDEEVTEGITEISFDYYTPTNASANFYLTNSANGYGTYGVCISISGTSVGVVNADKAISGMQQSKRHTVVARVNMDKHTLTFKIDGNDIMADGKLKEFPFRNNITSIKGGFFGVGQSTSNKTLEIDNFKVQRVYTGQSFIDQTFDNDETNAYPSGFTATNTSTTTGEAPKVVSKINDRVDANGSEVGKAIQLTGPTESGKYSRALYTLPYKVTDGLVDVSFDWYSATGDGYGEVLLCDDETPIAAFNVGGQKVQYVDQNGVVKDLATVAVRQWHKAVVHINKNTNTYTVDIDGVHYTSKYPVKNAKDLNEVHIRLSQANASGKTMQFDNFKVERVLYTLPSGYYDFEANMGILSGNGGSVEARINDEVTENGIEAGKAVQMNINSATPAQLDFTLPEVIEDGIVDISFDVYKSLNAPSLQFSLTNSAGGYDVLSSYINGAEIGGDYSGTYSSSFTEEQWHNVIFHLNFATKTVNGTLDGIPMVNSNGETQWQFRSDGLSDTTVTDIAKGFFKVDESSDTAGIIQIDNFRIVRNVTGDTPITLTLPDYMTADHSLYRIYGAPFAEEVGDLISQLSAKPAECTIYMTDKNGIRKESTDIVEKYDNIVIILGYAGIAQKYVICPTYSVDLRSIEINGNEYFEASKIIEPGKATVRARVNNFSPEPITVNVYGAVTGKKLCDVESEFNQEIAAGGYKDYKFELNIPDETDDLSLKLMVLDEKLAPITDYEQKLVFTSQELSMPNIFSDYMVLQRNEPVNIYGFAPTGTNIKVTFGEYSIDGVAENGKFLVQLPAMDATNIGKDLVVTANGEAFKTFREVVVGEVFYGSGQSNMAQALSWERSGREQIGQLPNLRYFTVKQLSSTQSRVDGTVSEAWKVIDSGNWTSVSSIMHCTVYHLRNLGILDESIPVGIINCSWGGTGIGMWMSSNALESISPTSDYFTNYLNGTADGNGIRQTDLFSAMAKSVTPYTVKAAVWYQGENDAASNVYNNYLDSMVAEMREAFNKKVPYFSIQLPGFNLAYWAPFRLTQWKSHDPENGINVVVTNDTGDISNIHPNDKIIVGERVARQMAKNVYGINIPYQGPVYKSATVSGSEVTVSFNFVNDGTHAGLCSIADNGTSLPNFELSADGNTWYAATAAISGDTVVLSSANVSAPAYVRFGYVAEPVKSLGTNTGGVKLPLAPFSEAIN